jgi:hypothetical protein
MLIFWKLVFVEDAPLYNKDFSEHLFPQEPGNTTYVPTDTDRLINLVAGIVLMACFVVSCSLNYLVYRFNKLKQSNITNFLFKSLSLVDLLTTVYAPWLYASLMFSSELYPCRTKLATFTRQLVCILGCTSQVITWMLAVTRFFRVILPFAMVSKKSVLVYIAVYCAMMTVNSTCSLIIQVGGWREPGIVMSVLVHCCFLVNLLHCSTGILFSVVTSVHLLWCTYLQTMTLQQTFQDHCNSNVSMIRQRMRSCVTILLMNIPYLTTICFIIYVNVMPGRISFHDVLFGFMPILTSTINPIIVTARNYQKIKMALFFRPKRTSRRSYIRSVDDMAMTENSKAMTSPRVGKGDLSQRSPFTVKVSIKTQEARKQRTRKQSHSLVGVRPCPTVSYTRDTTTISVETTFCKDSAARRLKTSST